VSLSFIFLLASAYFNYNTLTEADFLTHGAKYEAGDLDGPWVDKQTNLDFMRGEFLIITSLEMSLHGLLITSSYPVVSIDPLFSVLRC
jgi:hypothetical protein